MGQGRTQATSTETIARDKKNPREQTRSKNELTKQENETKPVKVREEKAKKKVKIEKQQPETLNTEIM